MRKKKNNSITTGSLIFSVEFNPHGPNVSEIINTDKHSLETDKKIETIISKNIYIYIIFANKRGRNLQKLLTRVDPYNIKSDLLELNVHGYKKCGKKCDSFNNFVDDSFLLYQKQLHRNIR